MNDFNFNNWLRKTKSGPYQKTLLTESEDQLYKVLGKSKHHLIAYPDPQGGYTKSELTAWYEKGHDLGQTRQVQFATSKDDAEELAGQNIDEDTYTQTYDQGGPENPQPEDEQFQEGAGDWGKDNWYASTEFAQGWEAYGSVGRDKCPYPHGTTEYHDWMDGWMSKATKVQQSHDEDTLGKEIGENEVNDAEATNNAIEYDHDAEVHTFDNQGMPPEYSMEEVSTDTSTDLADEIEELILKAYPKYYQDIRIGEYRPFKYDPDIPEFAEPVVLKHGYTGWEKLPDNLYSFLLSKFSVRERHGYDDDVQYIIYPKAGDRL